MFSRTAVPGGHPGPTYRIDQPALTGFAIQGHGCWTWLVTMSGDNPLAAFRRDLRQLHADVRSPAYRALRDHAGLQGVELPTSTIGTLLNGPGFPKRATVEAFVLACRSYARAHKITVAEQKLDLNLWHSRYNRLEAERADRADLAVSQQSITRRVRSRLAVPRQLPPDIIGFSGRTEEMAELNDLLRIDHAALSANSEDGDVTPAIFTVSGAAGVGKTALAVHWAHHVSAQFPDGQIYVDLRGFSPSEKMMSAEEAVRVILDALEVKADRIPADVDAQLSLYRRLIDGRRMLLILDNCHDAPHARPLLPGNRSVGVIVTSRDELSGLIITEGASPIKLDLLSFPDARDMLARRLGTSRVMAEQQAADEIIAYCARLPLAIAIIAARAALHPQFPLSSLAQELRDRRRRLDILTGGDPASDMRQVISWSLSSLREESISLFALLGEHPGPDISAEAACSLTGRALLTTRSQLSGLARANLVSENSPGRYSLHDLLRVYAGDESSRLPVEELEAAINRMVANYLFSAHAAALLLNPNRKPLSLASVPQGTHLEKFEDYSQALKWFKAEHYVIMAIARYCAESGRGAQASRIAWTLATYLERSGHWRDQSIMQRLAIATAGEEDQNIMAAAYNYLGRACQNLGLFEEADEHLKASLDLYRNQEGKESCAVVHLDLAVLSGARGRYSDAVSHAKEALKLGESAGNEVTRANALNSIGWFNAMLGNYGQGLDYCGQALAIEQAIENPDGEADTWDSLGYIHYNLSQHDHALECYERALELFRELGNRYYEANTLRHIAEVHYAEEHVDSARESLQLAVIILDDLDHPDAEQAHRRLLTFE